MRLVLYVARIPSRDDVTARVGTVAQSLGEGCDLIDWLAFLVAPFAPLVAIDKPKIPSFSRILFVFPLIPKMHSLCLEIAHVG